MKITDDMLSAQAAEARELWLQACTPDALPEHRFSRKFRREMRRLVRAQKHSAAFNRNLRLARRTAAVLLLSAAVSFGCAMSVEAYRVSLINTVVRVFNDLTDYRFSSALPSETDSMQRFWKSLTRSWRGSGGCFGNGGSACCWGCLDASSWH